MIQFGENIGWLLPLLIGCGAATALLYFINPDSFSIKTRIGLSILRFVILVLIGLFLLDPLIKYQSTEEEKPLYILGVDQSSSIVSNKDSNEVKALIAKITEDVTQRQDVQVEVLKFGSKTVKDGPLKFEENMSNISEYLNYTSDNYSYRNVVGHTLISDGIFNKGVDPQYVELNTSSPINVIGVGDTTKRPDQKIAEARFNKIVYLNNKFPLRVTVKGVKLKNKKVKLNVYYGEGKVLTRDIIYQTNEEIQTFDFEIEAKKLGIQLITIELNDLDNESNLANNRITVPVEVLDAKEQIAIIYQTITPDIGALNTTLSSNENLKVDLFSVQDLTANKIKELQETYNALILYQLPSIKNNLKPDVLSSLFKTKLPTMYVIGQTTNLALLNSLLDEFTLKGNPNGMFTTASSAVNQDFSLFKLTKDAGSIVNEYPPVQSPFGDYEFKGKSNVVLHQKIGGVGSDIPLWTFVEFNGKNSVFVFGEGIWRWPLAEYRKNENRKLFTNLVESSMAYLSIKKDLSRLRVSAKSNYLSETDIVLTAEVYNELYESINDPNVQLQLEHNDSLKYDFTFDRAEIGYELNLGQLEPGIYSYAASTEVNNEKLTKKGQFSVSESNVEQSNLEANHQVLYKIAKRTGGNFYSINDTENWKKNYNEQEFSSVLYTQVNFKDLINLRWFFALIIVLLGIEWLIRKREGSL